MPTQASVVIPAEANTINLENASVVIPAKAGIQRTQTGHRLSLVRRSYLLANLLALFLVSLPLAAHAYRATYEGVLVSEQSADPPVPVVLTMDVSLGVIHGKVETRLPLIGKGDVEGIEKFGTCEVHGDIAPATVLRLRGNCGMSDSVFEGTYRIRVRDKPYQEGTFRMTRVGTPGSPAAGRGLSDEPTFGGGSMTRCIDANRICLAGCRLSDYNETLLCTSRCRSAMTKCKAAVNSARPY